MTLLSAAASAQPAAWNLTPASSKSPVPVSHLGRIEFDAETLDRLEDGAEAVLPLPIRGNLPIRLERHVPHSSGNRSLIGKYQGGARDYVAVLTYGPAGLVGEIRTENGTYVVETTDGVTTVIDTAAAGWRPGPYRDDAVPPPGSAQPGTDLVGEAPKSFDLKAAEATPTPQTTVDLLVAYTPALVTRAGSVAGAQLRIDQLVAISNQAYVDSQVAITLRLVHSVQVTYSETVDNDVALNDLTSGAGALAGAATTLRGRYGADIVALLRPFNYPSQSGCGIAWIGGYGGNGANIGSQPNSGFAVVSDGADVNGSGYYCFNISFTHELGHNMGAMHDRATVTDGGTASLQTGAYSYSYGYVHDTTWNPAYGSNVCNPGSSTCFGTIMSYINATPEPKFSNPSVTTCAQSQVCGDSTDNVALTLNNTRAGVASWRPTKVPFVGTASGSGQSTTINAPFANALQVVLRDATGALVPGVTVVFSAPSSGASATLSTQSVTTDASGTAKVNATANGTSGSYSVTATATSGLVAAPFVFNLTNSGSTNLLSVQVIGPGTVSGTGINCPSTCTSLSAQGSTVTLTATASTNNTFMGWLGACSGTGSCTVSTSTPATVSATFASSSLLPVRVDVDASTRYDALTDGQLIMRYLKGTTGNALTAGLVASGAARTDPTAIATYLQNILPRLDIDGNGQVDAATDGVLIQRYLFGFRGNALIQNAIGSGAIRTTSAAIEQALGALVP